MVVHHKLWEQHMRPYLTSSRISGHSEHETYVQRSLGQGNMNAPSECSWGSINRHCVQLLPWWEFFSCAESSFYWYTTFPKTKWILKPRCCHQFLPRGLSLPGCWTSSCCLLKSDALPTTESLDHFQWHCSIAEWMDSERGIDTRQLWWQMQMIRRRTAQVKRVSRLFHNFAPLPSPHFCLHWQMVLANPTVINLGYKRHAGCHLLNSATWITWWRICSPYSTLPYLPLLLLFLLQ